MAEQNAQAKPPAGEGKKFFERAEQVAETGNWDFAIEMYLQGLRREPDNLDRGHKPLRNVSLMRKAKGGKSAGMMEQFKRRSGKDLLDNFTNTEYLLSLDPGSVSCMVNFLKAAQAMKVSPVVKWIGDILLEVQRQSPKPDKRMLLLITQAFADVEEYASAIAACDLARRIDPDDASVNEMLKNLSAKATIQQGRYDHEGDFTKSVRDMNKQKELAESDRMSKDQGFLAQQIEKKRQEYLKDPTVQGKVNSLVDELLKTEDEAFENEAIDVLTKAHKDTGAYQYKMRVGDIRIKQLTRRYRKLIAAGDKAAAAEQARRQLAFELEEFADRSVNYPTDLAIKFELGRRQLVAGKLDEAIASLQQATRDARRQLRAMTYLGQAFAEKKWYREAAETYERALQQEMPEDRAKEIRYYYGEVLEKMGDSRTAAAEKLERYQKAREEYSQVAQIDITYKDVRGRIEGLRKKIEDASK